MRSIGGAPSGRAVDAKTLRCVRHGLRRRLSAEIASAKEEASSVVRISSVAAIPRPSRSERRCSIRSERAVCPVRPIALSPKYETTRDHVMNTHPTTSRSNRHGATIAAVALLLCFAASAWSGEKSQSAAKNPGKTASSTPTKDPGPGAVVWMDSEKKIFYCAEHPKFGKAKQGYLIPEAHAKARGGRAFHGKSCS